jgi:tripartite-type tricarboxylate transporter receptor subunit TctC
MKGVFVPGGTPEEMISFMEDKLKDKDLSPEVRRALEAEIKSLCPHKETSTPVRHESGVKLTKCKKCGVYL